MAALAKALGRAGHQVGGVTPLYAGVLERFPQLNKLDWHIDLSFGIDLGAILPEFCLPQVCVDIPCVGTVCTPKICIDWPTITVPVSFGDFLKTTADFKIVVSLSGGKWKVEIEVLGVPNLQFGAS